MEKGNSQSEHGRPMELTRSLFSMCDSGVARCQSQHQCHFWRVNLMFEVYCQSNLYHSSGYERLQKSKDALKACFENVNITTYMANS